MPAIFPISTTVGGQMFGAPDTCKTPAPPAPSPVPIPYPNTAQCAQGVDQCDKVRASSRPVLTIKSKIPMSNGNEPGVAGGIKSGVNMGEGTYKKSSGKVRAGGEEVVYHSCMTSHNKDNFPSGAQVSPSQTKVRCAP